MADTGVTFWAGGFWADDFWAAGLWSSAAPAAAPLNVHGTLRDILGDLVGLRYYPNKFPQERGAPTWPAIRGTIVGRNSVEDQCGAGELNEDDVRVQLDFCATSYDVVSVLFANGCSALAAAASPWIRQPGAFDTWDADAKVHRISADFVLYQSSDED